MGLFSAARGMAGAGEWLVSRSPAQPRFPRRFRNGPNKEKVKDCPLPSSWCVLAGPLGQEARQGKKYDYGEVAMAAPASPVTDKNYNLIWAVQQSLENVWQLETYIKDAEAQGDEELARWFRRIQENNQKAGDQGKQMLMARLR